MEVGSKDLLISYWVEIDSKGTLFIFMYLKGISKKLVGSAMKEKKIIMIVFLVEKVGNLIKNCQCQGIFDNRSKR